MHRPYPKCADQAPDLGCVWGGCLTSIKNCRGNRQRVTLTPPPPSPFLDEELMHETPFHQPGSSLWLEGTRGQRQD